jgi:hypothetical protein
VRDVVVTATCERMGNDGVAFNDSIQSTDVHSEEDFVQKHGFAGCFCHVNGAL